MDYQHTPTTLQLHQQQLRQPIPSTSSLPPQVAPFTPPPLSTPPHIIHAYQSIPPLQHPRQYSHPFTPTLGPIPEHNHPITAHLPAARQPHTTPQRAAAKQLRTQHHIHQVAAHYATQDTKRKAHDTPLEDQQPNSARR